MQSSRVSRSWQGRPCERPVPRQVPGTSVVRRVGRQMLLERTAPTAPHAAAGALSIACSISAKLGWSWAISTMRALSTAMIGA